MFLFYSDWIDITFIYLAETPIQTMFNWERSVSQSQRSRALLKGEKVKSLC